MPILKIYVEVPHISDPSDSYCVAAFGYKNINPSDYNHFILARQFRDNCHDGCACDREYYNPAFLMVSGIFCESIESESIEFKDSILFFESIDAVEQKIEKIKKINLHKNNDLIIYQITLESPNDGWATCRVKKIILEK